ncbi:MAG: TonB family protein [Acidobacteriota bacterium]
MRHSLEGLLLEEPFDTVARPASLELPEPDRSEPPLLLTEPRPRRAVLVPLVGLGLTVALHGALLYVLATTRTDGLALLLPEALRDPQAMSEKTLRLFFVEQKEPAPPRKPAESPRLSDADRAARGGEHTEKRGPDPLLHGGSPERIYEPGAGSPARAAERGSEPSRSGDAGPEGRPTFDERSNAATRPTPTLTRKEILSDVAALPKYHGAGDRGVFGGSGAVASLDGGAAEGSVSFETSWFEWGDYATAMLRRIKWNWIPPHALYIGVKGHVRVSFVIHRSGAITDITLEQSSGTSSYDEAAMAAISASSPLSALPEKFPFDREKVTINFLYNMSRLAENRGPGSGEPGS